MDGHHHHHHHPHHNIHQQQQQQYMQQQQQQQQMSSGGAGVTTVGVDTGDRFPQWSSQETKEFLIIRAELDRNFMETKRNKLLWEVISTKMREKGFNRSSEQCKCKWKNLVTRYKGCETMEAEGMRQQFPYYNEMQGIFTARMQRMLWVEEEGGPGPSPSPGLGPSKKNKMSPGGSSDEEEEEGNNTDGEKGGGGGGGGYKKKKATSSTSNKKTKVITTNSSYNESSSSSINAIREMMEEYMKAEMERETQWREEYEAREEERRRAEREWRERMEGLERERIRMETIWREKEEQRKMREEVRAEKRDALITTLLNKLRREDSGN